LKEKTYPLVHEKRYVVIDTFKFQRAGSKPHSGVLTVAASQMTEINPRVNN